MHIVFLERELADGRFEITIEDYYNNLFDDIGGGVSI